MSNDDTQPSEMPPQPKTKEIPAARPEDILLAEVRNGFRAINTRLDTLEGVDRDIAGEVSRMGREIVDLRADGRRHEDDIRRLSDRTKETHASASNADMGQAAALADEKTAREALAAKVDELSATNAAQLAILNRIDKLASNPLVKTIATVIGTAFLTWAASRGIK